MDETPGFDASQLQALVLDEADRILDMVSQGSRDGAAFQPSTQAAQSSSAMHWDQQPSLLLMCSY